MHTYEIIFESGHKCTKLAESDRDAVLIAGRMAQTRGRVDCVIEVTSNNRRVIHHA